MAFTEGQIYIITERLVPVNMEIAGNRALAASRVSEMMTELSKKLLGRVASGS